MRILQIGYYKVASKEKIKKKMILLQTPPNKTGDREILKVFDNGKILCVWCMSNLYLPTREFESVFCYHLKEFLKAFPELENYLEIKQ